MKPFRSFVIITVTREFYAYEYLGDDEEWIDLWSCYNYLIITIMTYLLHTEYFSSGKK